MNNRRGISLIMLIVTIVLALILIMSTAAVIGNAINNSRITTFASDVLEVQDAVKSYYVQHDEIPILGEDKVYSQQEIENFIQTGKQLVLFEEELDLNGDFNANRNLGAFYVLDLSKLGIEQTTRGLKKDNTDVYVVSYPSFHVYYMKGLNTRKTSYFSMSSRLSSLIKNFNRKTTTLSTQITTQTVEGITVKKMNKKWTNLLGVTIETYISDASETLYLKVQDGAEVQIPTKTGQNVLRLDSLTKALAADGTSYTLNTDLSKYNTAQQKDKYMEIIKKKSGNIVGRVRTNLQEYETENPTLKGNIKLYPSEEYNLATFYMGDTISGIKEVRYEYLTEFNSQTYPEPYYAGITTYEPSYIKARGKKATVSEDGYVEIKIPKEIEGIEVRAFDHAGNTSDKITIGNKRDIYIGINAKYLTKAKSVFDVIFNSSSKITSANISISNNGSNYTSITNLTVPSPTSSIAKVENIMFDNLTNYSDTIYVKISAINANGTTETRIQKFTLNNVQTDLVTPGVPVTKNTYYLMDGKLAVIPKDFAVSTKISEQSIDHGLVIYDKDGNEFVWIPVDGTNVKYEKWCTSGLPHTQTSDVENTEYPVGVTKETEKSIVEKVGGFYIGRYEAGVPDNQTAIDGESGLTSNKAGIPVSKKGAKVWTSIDYTNANANARAYKNNNVVASGLLTGTGWDTVCKWLQNSGYNVGTDSRAWGNYKDSIAPANVVGFGSKQVTGFSEYWKANNIYDLVGNTWGWTNELYSSFRVFRGGNYYYSGSNYPASNRGDINVGYTNSNFGFRLALYIKTDGNGEGTKDLADLIGLSQAQKSRKPYIPAGFEWVSGTTVDGGYVIADTNGNEFVWIPVDGTNVKYEKWCTVGLSYLVTDNVSDSEYPSGVTSATEKAIVDKAGGFYVGRYEAGVPDNQTSIDGTSAATSNKFGIPVSKKGAVTWTYIDYINANANARAYKNNNEVISGLLTGTQWDTVCKWLQNSGYSVTDSRTWGNYSDSLSSANVSGFGKKQVTGYSDFWKANNINDLSGNIWEWTNELNTTLRVCRGGAYGGSGSTVPSSYRDRNVADYTSVGLSFRLVLYIKTDGYE